MDNLRVDGARLWRTIMETAEIGGTPKGGVNRQALTDLDAQVRHRLIAWAEAAGCTVTIDQVGNIFARRPGRDPSLPPVAVGSHLDTQPTGGKFDGILGVLAGLELIRTLNDAGYETDAPIELINWTNEEGARFAPAMLASGVFTGRFALDYALGRPDRDGKRFGDELARIGFAGETPAGGHALAAFFELHIEQGPILEAEGKTIGVVTGVQGIRWYSFSVTGQDSHAGTTPMTHRHDAFQGLARFAVALDRIAREEGGGAVATSAWSRSGRAHRTSCRASPRPRSTCATPRTRRSTAWSWRFVPPPATSPGTSASRSGSTRPGRRRRSGSTMPASRRSVPRPRPAATAIATSSAAPGTMRPTSPR